MIQTLTFKEVFLAAAICLEYPIIQ